VASGNRCQLKWPFALGHKLFY